ncbi:MAG: LysE family translocator [Cohaesibacteraceae bacterium]|nr:LysE family translocator [Cohaesibacteraceae bacterium]
MDWTTFGAFAVFVIVMTGTPGPGNLTFMAIGASAGYRTAFPVIIASQIGSFALNMSVAFGLGQIMAQGGPLVNLFKLASMMYMSWLAWRIISMNINPRGDAALPGFWEGLLIHPLSPKTWAMSLVAFASFFAANGQGSVQNAVLLTAGFFVGGMVFHSLYAFAGVSILKILGEGRTLRIITIFMAIAMLGATAWSLML